jgi:hypothetical protein
MVADFSCLRPCWRGWSERSEGSHGKAQREPREKLPTQAIGLLRALAPLREMPFDFAKTDGDVRTKFFIMGRVSLFHVKGSLKIAQRPQSFRVSRFSLNAWSASWV